jgi:hypothetical protein
MKYLNTMQETFAKTQEEKDKLKTAKLRWRAMMRLHYSTFTKKKAFNFSQSVISAPPQV